MSKLYPPVIDSRIPGFYKNDESKLIVKVPFINNRAVSKSDITGFKLRIKTTATDGIVLEKSVTDSSLYDSKEITFTIPSTEWKTTSGKSLFNLGQYYKIQLGYIPKNVSDAYLSSVGISKYTSMPLLSIEDLSSTQSNPHTYNYVGKYEQKDSSGNLLDITEKVYYYKFQIVKGNDEIFYDSDWLLHDSRNDINESTSEDFFEYLSDIPTDGTYKIKYMVQTNTGMEGGSPLYEINSNTTVVSSVKCTAENNFDDGFVFVAATGLADTYTGPYCVVRNEVGSITKEKIGILNSDNIFRDFTIEQGKKYEYRIFFKNGDVPSTSATSSAITADYEDMFLFDGERQLKIRFNPTVGSYTESLQETKVDTIGSKYPVILRSGNARYFTLNIGGLVSYNMDENGYFYPLYATVNNYRSDTKSTATEVNGSTTAKNAENFYKERIFRDEVLNWLNNGQPKLFKSQSEGLKLVKTMNNSMAPFQGISRMLYTFSSNAVEFDGHEYTDLVKNNIYKV